MLQNTATICVKSYASSWRCSLHVSRQVREDRLDTGRHADDRVHRCADFMAHLGEKIGLGFGGGFGCLFGYGQIGSLRPSVLKQLSCLQLALVITVNVSKS